MITDIRDEGTAPCAHVGELLQSKLDEIQRRRQKLTALERELNQLVERSRSLDPVDCTDADICHILQNRLTPGKLI